MAFSSLGCGIISSSSSGGVKVVGLYAVDLFGKSEITLARLFLTRLQMIEHFQLVQGHAF